MRTIRLRQAFFAGLFACATLGAVLPAQAVVYTGHWDPLYGAPFPNLGWKGSATFSIPDACLAGSGWIANNDPCANGAMSILGAEVDFYNAGDPLMTTVQTLVFDPSVVVYKMRVDSHQLTAVSSDFLGPEQGTVAIAGGGTYWFDLKFIEAVSNNVQLYHTVGHTDPICAFTGTPAGCGVSANQPTITITAIPEPSIFALSLGGLALGWAVRRRRR